VTYSSISVLALTTLVLQHLQSAAEQSAKPCVLLREQVTALTTRFLSAPPTPASTLEFETSLLHLLTECGRLIVEDVLNHIEPQPPQEAPKHTQRDGQDYSRKNEKSRNRGGIATLFGTIDLQRCLYEPLQEARDDQRLSFSPLELCLGIIVGTATPALAERVARLSSRNTQQEMLDILKRENGVDWSIKSLRKVTGAVSAGIQPYLRKAQLQALLQWLAEANKSRGRGRIVLAVGRDGILLPMRNEPHQKEAGVATISVHDRGGRRLGTIYQGEMPQEHQVRLSTELTALLQDVLKQWEGPMPELLYLTDAGYQQTVYYEKVLMPMEDPRRPGNRLDWKWIVDFYHAASYVTKLAKVLFTEEGHRKGWARRMRHLMRDKENGVMRLLQSAAQYHGMKSWSEEEEKEYESAYNYLLNHSPMMKYHEYKKKGWPIGSGVTEAGCKVVFTQRFKQSGMTWGLSGGEVVLRLRLAVLSGVWDQVFRDFLDHLPVVHVATRIPFLLPPDRNAA
jgi:hypothetical protein